MSTNREQFFKHIYSLYKEIATPIKLCVDAYNKDVDNVYPKSKLWNTSACTWARFVSKYAKKPNNIYHCFLDRIAGLFHNCNLE